MGGQTESATGLSSQGSSRRGLPITGGGAGGVSHSGMPSLSIAGNINTNSGALPSAKSGSG